MATGEVMPIQDYKGLDSFPNTSNPVPYPPHTSSMGNFPTANNAPLQPMFRSQPAQGFEYSGATQSNGHPNHYLAQPNMNPMYSAAQSQSNPQVPAPGYDQVMDPAAAADFHAPNPSSTHQYVNAQTPRHVAQNDYYNPDMVVSSGMPTVYPTLPPASPYVTNGVQLSNEQLQYEQLKLAIRRQTEYYFSVDNLVRDVFLRGHMDAQGWVSIGLLATFNRMKVLTSDVTLIYEAVLGSEQLDVASLMVRKRHQWEKWVLPGEYTGASDSAFGTQYPQPSSMPSGPTTPEGSTTGSLPMPPPAAAKALFVTNEQRKEKESKKAKEEGGTLKWAILGEGEVKRKKHKNKSHKMADLDVTVQDFVLPESPESPELGDQPAGTFGSCEEGEEVPDDSVSEPSNSESEGKSDEASEGGEPQVTAGETEGVTAEAAVVEAHADTAQAASPPHKPAHKGRRGARQPSVSDGTDKPRKRNKGAAQCSQCGTKADKRANENQKQKAKVSTPVEVVKSADSSASGKSVSAEPRKVRRNPYTAKQEAAKARKWYIKCTVLTALALGLSCFAYFWFSRDMGATGKVGKREL